jgi:alpha-galactosidase
MWAVVAAPLVIGADVRALSSETVAMLSNPDVIAVDQDPLGIQGILSSRDSDRDIEVWVKPLFGGAKAVALLNRGTQQQPIEVDTADIGLPATSALQIRDLWTGATSTEAGAIAAEVSGHGARLYRVTPAAPT